MAGPTEEGLLENLYSLLSDYWVEAYGGIVVEKDRQNDLLPVFDYFIRRVKEFKRIGAASVVSAVELSEEQKERLREKLLASTDYVMFEMDYQVDPALIGGMVIRIGDRVVDSSIRTRLYEMKKELLQLQMA